MAVQLCYYRGMAGFHSSQWLTEPGALLDQMSGVSCEAGITQIGRVLRHALDAGSVSQPIRALIFVGDACEEAPEPLLSLAGQCGIKNCRCFCFRKAATPPPTTSSSGWLRSVAAPPCPLMPAVPTVYGSFWAPSRGSHVAD